MKTIIIDDDPSIIIDLSRKLSCHADLHIAGTAQTGKDGMKLLRAERPELVFLDMELPDTTGLDILRQIDEEDLNCHVIVCTAFSNYMLPAFRHEAYDFITKPIDENELRGALDRVRHDMENPRSSTSASTINTGHLLLYTNTEDFQLVSIDQIGVFQYNADVRSWEVIVATQQKPFKLKREVSNKDILRFDERFVQVSQRAIINIDYLMKVKDDCCHFMPPFDYVDSVAVGRQYRRKLIDRFHSF